MADSTPTATLLSQHAGDLADALEAAVNVMLACVVPASGCDDESHLADAIEQGEAALAAAGRLFVREPL